MRSEVEKHNIPKNEFDFEINSDSINNIFHIFSFPLCPISLYVKFLCAELLLNDLQVFYVP